MNKLQQIKESLIEKLKPSGWMNKLKTFILSEEFDQILEKLFKLVEDGKRFTPATKSIFRCFTECPYNDLKVVIIGQDPYFTMKGPIPVADGLAFSCGNTGFLQPSLKSILKEVHRTVYGEDATYNYDPDLTRWANQGVLLLNSALTVEIGKPGTHYDIWDSFIAYVLDIISKTTSGIHWVFMGKKAQELSELIDENTHYVWNLTHPASAAYKEGVWNCEDVFNNINNHIEKNNGKEFKIKW